MCGCQRLTFSPSTIRARLPTREKKKTQICDAVNQARIAAEAREEADACIADVQELGGRIDHLEAELRSTEARALPLLLSFFSFLCLPAPVWRPRK